MKILAIYPSVVKPAVSGVGWSYTVLYIQGNRRSVYVPSEETYPSASAAKQAMREEVTFLRRKHCV